MLEEGPELVPVRQSQVSAHQPQELPAVHDEHDDDDAQGSGAVQEVHIHEPHEPEEGPVEVPVRQLHVSSHQPQVLPAMHDEHDDDDAHGSAAVQALLTQSQLVHDPVDGPALLPVRQLDVSSHQPQLAMVVHPSQLADEAHGSEVEQALLTQLQSAHDPVEGPELVPVRQSAVSSHQPQLAVVVQASQFVDEAHGSPAHSLLSHIQSPQDPEEGPALVPVWQLETSSHQPQPEVTEHEPQVA